MNNLVTLWPNLFRAIEIAILGRFTIKLTFDKDDYFNGQVDIDYLKEQYLNTTKSLTSLMMKQTCK